MAENSGSETTTYETAKTYLKAALEHLIAAGQDVGDLSEFAIEKFGDTFSPYLRQFMRDVHDGRVKIQGLTDSARIALVGHHITAEEREAMIREAAYLRAEQRGFVGGSAKNDWLLAEQEIDQRLARESGLVSQGHQLLTSTATTLEQELGSVKDAVIHWLEDKGVVAKKSKSKSKKASKKKKVTKKSAPTKKPKEPKKKPAEKKKETEKTGGKKTSDKKGKAKDK